MIEKELFAAFPRIHTAIAEWLACMLYIIPRTKRFHGWKLYLLCLAFLGPMLLTNTLSETQDGIVWVLLMAGCMAEMLLLIYLCCRTTIWKAIYYWSHAFIAAEFAASLEWQINCYLIYDAERINWPRTYICMAIVYIVVFGTLWLLNKRRNLLREQPHTTWREAIAMMAIAIAMFTLGNSAFAFRGSILSQSLGAGVLFVRTLSDLSGLFMLYAYDEQRMEMQLRYELEAMDSLLNRQYEQFRMAEANNETLHRIYHDLKHQIAFIKNEQDEEKKSSYLSELEQVVAIHEAEANTGNSVLDTILTHKKLLCAECGITLTYFADASSLDQIDILDICSIFGNAIDNAIEYEQRLTPPEMRLIKLIVRPQNQFLLIRVENYCPDKILISDEDPRSTKVDSYYHGFGLKSIRRAVEKYGGNVNLRQEGLWFILTILLPLR